MADRDYDRARNDERALLAELIDERACWSLREDLRDAPGGKRGADLRGVPANARHQIERDERAHAVLHVGDEKLSVMSARTLPRFESSPFEVEGFAEGRLDLERLVI